jgi:hypothetical protein
VYELGSNIDLTGAWACTLAAGGGGAVSGAEGGAEGGEGARYDEGPFTGGGGGGAEAGDACPAARIAACMARL